MFEHLDCDALTQWLRCNLQRITDDLDDNCMAWACFDWHKTSDAKVVNAVTSSCRRADHHAKQFALRTAIASSEAASSASAGRMMAGISAPQVVAWKQKEMSSFQAVSLFTFDNVESVSVVYDAARLGNPAKEILAILATNLASRRHVALPPQVLGGHNGSWSCSNIFWQLQITI